LSDASSLLSTMGNLMVLFMFYFRFQLASLATSPSVVFYIAELANMITGKEARQWFKSNEEHTPQLLHYVLAQIIAISTSFAKASRDVMVTNYITQNQLDQIPTRHFALAHSIFEDAKSTLHKVFLNSVPIPLSALWTNSKAKRNIDDMAARDLLAKIQSATPPVDSKKRKSEEQLTPTNKNKLARTGDKSGWIRCNGPNLSLPTELFNKDYKLCKSKSRDGQICQFGDNCKKDHSPLAQLDHVKQKAIVRSVDADNKQHFVNFDKKLLDEIRAR